MQSTASFVKSKIIQAGAGAGKTTRLIQTFIDFANDYKNEHGKYPRIVVSTFTKKATQELKERLISKAYELNDLEMVRWIGRPSQVHISTLHGLLVPFLSRYGNSCGLNPEIKIISQLDLNKLYRKIVKKILTANPDHLEILDELSWDELIQNLLICYNKKSEHGVLNFDSAEEIKKWSESEFSNWIHSRQILKTSFEGIQLSESWINYLQDFFRHVENWNEVSDWLDFLGRKPPFKADKPAFSTDLHDRLIEVKELAEKRISQSLIFSKNWARFDQVQKIFCKIFDLFSQQLLETQLATGKLSLSDLENLSLEVIRRDPSVAQSFSRDWDFWMIDEYQDTAPVQVQLLKAFMQNSPHFIVGDPQQSIYLFRGARTEVFQEKVQDLISRNQSFEQMNYNYRSSFELVQFFNSLFTGFSTQFMQMQAFKKPEIHSTTAVQISVVPEVDSLEDSEILTVLAQIQKLIESGVQPQSIAILARSNAKLKSCLKLSQKYKIGLESPNLSDFWKRREILDLIFLTQFLINPHNNINFFGLLRSPGFFVEDELLLNLHGSNSYWLQACQSSDQDFKKVTTELQKLMKVASQWGISQAIFQFLTESDFLLASQLIDSTGRREANIWKFLTELRIKEKQPGVNLLEFLDEIMLGENIDVDVQSQEAPPLIEPNRVHLMTVHASKGLEFDYVFLLSIGQESALSQNQILSFDEISKTVSVAIRDDNGKWMYSPLSEKVRDTLRTREKEESLRVLYVAATRAKKSLWLSTKSQFKKNSWWGMWPLSQQLGTHENYIVQEIFETPKVYQDPNVGDIKSLFPLNYELSETLVRKSVTQVLEENKSYENVAGIKSNKIEALKKAQLGTYLHRVFESLALNQDNLEVDDKWKQSVDYLLNLKEVPMKLILQQGFPEWGFSVQMDQYVLQGTIDLWADLDDAVYIVDYKTGSHRYSDSAISQMQIYADALKKMRVIDPQKKIILAALYPLEQKAVTKTV